MDNPLPISLVPHELQTRRHDPEMRGCGRVQERVLEGVSWDKTSDREENRKEGGVAA